MIFEKSWRSRALLLVWAGLWSVGCPDTSVSVSQGSASDVAAAPEEATPVDASEVRSESSADSELDPEVIAARRANRVALTEDALDQLQASADFLAKVTSYRFEADTSFDVLQRNGQILEFGAVRTATVRRPDRLRIDVKRRGGDRASIYFDGRSYSVDLPDHAAFVHFEKPGTVDAILDYLSTDLETPTPLEPFLSSNFAADVEDRVESGYFVDVEQLGDRWCEHFAYRTSDVDFELWIEEGDRPLPCRVVITYKREAGDPQFVAQFRSWDLTAETPDSLFAFTPPENAEHLAAQAVAQAIRDAEDIQ